MKCNPGWRSPECAALLPGYETATGLDLAVGTADEFDAFIRSEYVKWEKVARVARIVTD